MCGHRIGGLWRMLLDINRRRFPRIQRTISGREQKRRLERCTLQAPSCPGNLALRIVLAGIRWSRGRAGRVDCYFYDPSPAR